MREHRSGPFFIGAGFHKPHLPWIAPKKYFRSCFRRESMLLPENPSRRISAGNIPASGPDHHAVPTGAQLSTNATNVRDGDRRLPGLRGVSSMPKVGVLLHAMDELKLWDNTVVVLWGDHGWHLGDHGGLWGKLTVFEQAAHVPLIVAAPNKPRGRGSARLVEFVDLYPTLTDLCSLPTAAGMEGTSFVPLLDDPARHWKRAAFTQVLRDTGRQAIPGRARWALGADRTLAIHRVGRTADGRTLRSRRRSVGAAQPGDRTRVASHRRGAFPHSVRRLAGDGQRIDVCAGRPGSLMSMSKIARRTPNPLSPHVPASPRTERKATPSCCACSTN